MNKSYLKNNQYKSIDSYSKPVLHKNNSNSRSSNLNYEMNNLNENNINKENAINSLDLNDMNLSLSRSKKPSSILQSASGKNVMISLTSKQKYSDMFNKDDYNDFDNSNISNSETLNRSNNSKSSTVAENEVPFKISNDLNDLISNVCKVYSGDIYNKHLVKSNSNDKNSPRNTSTTLIQDSIEKPIKVSSMLQTASGRNVCISAKSFDKVKNIITANNNEVKFIEDSTCGKNNGDLNTTIHDRKISNLFVNAKGNPVSISANAVEKSNRLFHENINELMNESKVDLFDENKICEYEHISKESNKLNKQFDDCDDSENNNCDFNVIDESRFNHNNDFEIDDYSDNNDSQEVISQCSPIINYEKESYISGIDQISMNKQHIFKDYNSQRYLTLLQINSSSTDYLHFNKDMIYIDISKPNDIFNQICIHLHGSPSAVSISSSKWLKMQLNWIIWTFASYERKYPLKYFNKLLTLSSIFECISERFNLYNRTNIRSIENKLIIQISQNKHRTARNHFSVVGAMSSLQRCCEIHYLLNPIIVCILINSKINHCRVTDGWWQCTLKIDSHIKELIRKRRILDGIKIIIFDASFLTENDEDIMCVSINQIKKVKDSCRLGYCNPKYLRRGISINSIKSDGGLVQAISGKVIDQSLSMSRIISDNKILLTRDLNLLKDIVNQYREKEMKKFEKSSQSNVDVDDLIDDLNCPSWIKEAVKMLHKYGELRSQFSEEDIKQIMKYKEKLHYMIQNQMNENIKEINSDFEINSFDYIDLLIQCTISMKLCWIRLSQETLNQFVVNSVNLKNKIHKTSVIGLKVFISNLKPIMKDNIMILTTTKSSTIKVIDDKNENVTNDDVQQLIVKPRYIINKFAQNEDSNSTKEVSITCKVINYNIITNQQLHDKENLKAYNMIEIHAVDSTNISILVELNIPVLLMSHYLQIISENKIIIIHYGLITWIDLKYEIIRITQSDRTYISIANDVDIQSDLKIIDCIQIEKRRLDALRNNHLWFIPYSSTLSKSTGLKSILHSCQRFQLYNVIITWMTIPTEYNNFAILQYDIQSNEQTQWDNNIFEVKLDILPTIWIEEYYTYYMTNNDADNENSNDSFSVNYIDNSQYYHHLGLNCNLSYCLCSENDVLGGTTYLNPQLIWIEPRK